MLLARQWAEARQRQGGGRAEAGRWQGGGRAEAGRRQGEGRVEAGRRQGGGRAESAWQLFAPRQLSDVEVSPIGQVEQAHQREADEREAIRAVGATHYAAVMGPYPHGRTRREDKRVVLMASGWVMLRESRVGWDSDGIGIGFG